MEFEARTQNEKQKEFDTYIFRLLELIENMNDIKDGEYKESCDIFMNLRKMFQETKQQLIHNPIFNTMIRRRIRNVGEARYVSELEKVFDDNYERCERCSSIIKKSYMKTHLKTKKCCMNHEAKFQSIKIGEITDDRIANRMIYASTFTFNLRKVKSLGELDKKQRIIIYPNYERLCEEYGKRIINSKTLVEINELEMPNPPESIDWYKDENGKWCENGKA